MFRSIPGPAGPWWCRKCIPEMIREISFLQKPFFRMGLLIFLSALLHLLLLLAISGAVGGRPGVNRLPDIICVSVVPKAGIMRPRQPEAFRLSEDQRDKLRFAVSARPNVPEVVDEIHVDRLRKARVSRPDSEDQMKRSNSQKQRLIQEIPNAESRLDLAEGSGSYQDLDSLSWPSSLAAPPRLLHKIPLVYPELARQRGWQGVVELNVEVLAHGSVGDVFLVKSSGYQVLDEAALGQVKQFKYLPGLENGQAFSMRIIQPVRFELKSSFPGF
jgi:TonB family protein